ncbi:MAG: carboxylating nicotinate-nucleotide diphosphorylase [Bacillota bacterium]
MNELELDLLIRKALAEDIGAGDWTTTATVAAGTRATGVLRSREAGVVAGLEVARRVFGVLDPSVEFRNRVADGERVQRGTVLAEVSGAARPILSGERVALNFLCRLSGIATRTRRLSELVEGYPVRLVDTRKTTPGLRMLEKYAVRVGGGHNHRFALDDGVLIKDNHIAVAGGITAAVRSARAAAHHLLKVEVEVEDLDGVREALAAGADVILLDNMPPALIEEAVRLVDGRVLLEASGNVDEQNIREIAATGVDLISLGRLTHSVPDLDIGLDLERPGSFSPRGR